MRCLEQQFRAVSQRTVRRTTSGCALLGGPLLVLLLVAELTVAQTPPSRPMFSGMRRNAAASEAAGQPPPREPIRRPSDVDRAIRLAAADVGATAQPRGTEALPPPGSVSQSSPTRVEGALPMTGWDADVDIAPGPRGRIDRLVVRDASLSKVLALLAQTYHLNIVAANDIDAVISITLRDVALDEALTAILSVANYTWVNRDGIILITSLSDSAQLPPGVQGRETQIFDLDFVSATVVSEAVTNFLSPIGKMSVVTSDPTDNRRTREMIVVEDIPEALARIGSYIDQVDCPPRQVLIEAHILQVTLKDNEKNGVNFDALFRIAGAKVNILSIPSVAAVPLPTPGVAPTPPSTPAVLATVAGHDLQAVIDLLQTTNDTKTLGSPKVLVLNQQQANIHVGEDLGYQTTVTSELQSTQAPQFLQVGVLLDITPRITRDNRVLLHVAPQVSTGAIDPITQVPNKKTTELTTDVMLNDGEGMVIGGLIDEQDLTSQTKWPYLGDLWRVGFLFRHSDVTKERKEVIIALLPRIQPYSPAYENFEQGEAVRAETPLFHGPLCYVDRPYESHLPDGLRVARPYIPPGAIPPKVDRQPCNYCVTPRPRYYVPQKPYPTQQLVDETAGDYSGDFGRRCLPPSPQPELASPVVDGEFVPEYGGYDDNDGSIISDRP
jgi:type IV pilus assembly protein PilQ